MAHPGTEAADSPIVLGLRFPHHSEEVGLDHLGFPCSWTGEEVVKMLLLSVQSRDWGSQRASVR